MPIVRSRKASTSAAVPPVVAREDGVDEGVRDAGPLVEHRERRHGRGAAAAAGKIGILGARLDEQRTGRDQRREVEVLDRAELPRQHLRTAHVPRHGVGGGPRGEVAGHDRGGDALVEGGEEQRTRPAVREPGDCDPIGRDERVFGEQVERTAQVPQVALERHDAGHRRADEVPVAVVLVVGHPVGAFTEAAEVGREHDMTHRRELVRVVVARAAFDEAAHHRLARSVPVDREHGGSRRDPLVRDEQIRGHRHGGFGVDDDAVAAVRAAVDRLGDLDVRCHRDRVGSEQIEHARVGARPPRLEPGGIVDGTRIRRDDGFEVQAPVRPVGEVAHPRHASSAQPRPPARWLRYAGVSHADGK